MDIKDIQIVHMQVSLLTKSILFLSKVDKNLYTFYKIVYPVHHIIMLNHVEEADYYVDHPILIIMRTINHLVVLFNLLYCSLNSFYHIHLLFEL